MPHVAPDVTERLARIRADTARHLSLNTPPDADPLDELARRSVVHGEEHPATVAAVRAARAAGATWAQIAVALGEPPDAAAARRVSDRSRRRWRPGA